VDSIRLQMSAKNLDKNHSFSSANPYVVISQVRPDGSRVCVFQTSVVNGSQNPSWPASNVYLPLLCNSDDTQPLIAEVWDYSASNQHELIGATAPITLDDLVNAPEDGTGFPLVNPAKAGKKGYTNSGVLSIGTAEPYNAPRVQDYIRGGLRFKCAVAVDFTSGNGPSSSPAGYHYLGAEGDGSVVSNPYAATLAVLASVMAKLNGGHPLKAYGFGATPAGSKSAPPLFSLKSPSSASGTKDVEVDDAAALVDAYRASAASVHP